MAARTDPLIVQGSQGLGCWQQKKGFGILVEEWEKYELGEARGFAVMSPGKVEAGEALKTTVRHARGEMMSARARTGDGNWPTAPVATHQRRQDNDELIILRRQREFLGRNGRVVRMARPP